MRAGLRSRKWEAPSPHVQPESRAEAGVCLVAGGWGAPVSRRLLGSSREGAQVCRDIREDSAECPGPSSYEGR